MQRQHGSMSLARDMALEIINHMEGEAEAWPAEDGGEVLGRAACMLPPKRRRILCAGPVMIWRHRLCTFGFQPEYREGLHECPRATLPHHLA